MPTMPPPKPPPKPGDPGYLGDANAEPGGFGTSKEIALTALGVAAFLASRGRLSEGTSKFIMKTAAGTLASTGALTLSRASTHGDENAKKARIAAAVRDAIVRQALTTTPKGPTVIFVNKRTGERKELDVEVLNKLIEAGIIKVKDSKTKKPIIKIEMKKPWLADP